MPQNSKMLPASIARTIRTLLVALLTLGVVAGCTVEEEINYYVDAKPIIDRNCVSCHRAGGAAPFALDTYEAVTTYQAAMQVEIESGRMPPWLPDPDCRRYPKERVMSDEDKALFSTWVDEGSVEGDAAAAVEIVVPSIALATVSFETVTPNPYTPNGELQDDYRCLLLDKTFDETAFITGYQVVPDQSDLVHHVLLYVVPPDSLEDFNAADDADDGEGFTCFSDPGVQAMLMGTWVPGAPATTLPNNIGFEVPAGSRLAMQVHYNLLGNTTAPDRTVVQVQLSELEPFYKAENVILVDDEFNIPAGVSSYSASATFENPLFTPITVISALPHMHLLGKSIRFDYIDSDENETCVVDIPRWDFNWQQTYDFNEEDFVVVQPGEAMKVTCEWDNSAERQVVVDGEQLVPTDVIFGEGTQDEMCIVIITAVIGEL